MIAEIVSIGTELLLGQIVNSDAQYLSRKLSEAGVFVYYHTTVGDNPARLMDTLRQALTRADIVITTGGLGPTADDLTKETAAELLDLPMETDASSAEAIRAFFDRLGRNMTDNNLRQARFAKGARILPNAHGTAPGCIVEKGGKAIVHLPGPPGELVPMFETSVMPYLMEKSGQILVSRYLRVFGMGESEVENRLSDLMNGGVNPTIASYCSVGEVELRLTVRVRAEKDAAALLAPAEETIRARLGSVIYAACTGPDRHMEHVLLDTLAARGETLAVAESCTGGMLAARLVGVPGASRVFQEGFVAYANGAKMRALGVRQETLTAHGAVSEQTACEMASGARAASGATYALSTTGIAGPEGGTAEKPVGLVYIGLATPQGTTARRLLLRGGREKIRILACLHAMHTLLSSNS